MKPGRPRTSAKRLMARAAACRAAAEHLGLCTWTEDSLRQIEGLTVAIRLRKIAEELTAEAEGESRGDRRRVTEAALSRPLEADLSQGER